MGPHSSGLGPHVPLPEYIENMRKIALHLKGRGSFICRGEQVSGCRDTQGAQGIRIGAMSTLEVHAH
ncbi:hypothetical protein ACSBR2_007787 [Camellia fascicularis]